jgi:hypothetical protein
VQEALDKRGIDYSRIVEKSDLVALLQKADADHPEPQEINHEDRAGPHGARQTCENTRSEAQRERIIQLAARAKAEFESNKDSASDGSYSSAINESRKERILELFGRARTEYERSCRSSPSPHHDGTARQHSVSMPVYCANFAYLHYVGSYFPFDAEKSLSL